MCDLDRRGFLLGAVAAATVARDTPASSRDWLLLGSAVVRRAQETIEIRITTWPRSFAHIKLGVRKDDAHLIRGVRMKTLRITFADGDTLRLPIQSLIETGATTPSLKLDRRKRSIRHVQLDYALAPTRRFVDRKARGTIELWGRR